MVKVVLHSGLLTTYLKLKRAVNCVQFCILLRIEIHILSLHWMIQKISYFNVCEGLLIANVFHHPVQA